MPPNLASRARLNNGVEMPWMGLGTWELRSGNGAERAVRSALSLGYRLIDTAKLYRNEADVGRAIRESGVPRDEVFVTTKLWNSDHGYEPALKAFDRSLRELGLDYVDLYLVHWPESGKREETWKAFERILADGKARAIGVSNYTVRHLEEMETYAAVTPAVNQIEFSPFLYQRDVLDYGRKHGIQLEAYSPLTRSKRLGDPRVAAIAGKRGRTPAQVLLRWALEHEAVPIPKSADPGRQRENLGAFDFSLSAEDMKALDGIGGRFRVDWDPTDEP